VSSAVAQSTVEAVDAAFDKDDLALLGSAPLGKSGVDERLLSLDGDELVELLGGSGRAKVVWRTLKHGLNPGEVATTMRGSGTGVGEIVPTTLGAASKEVVNARLAGLPPVVHTVASKDGTRKMLLRLADGMEVETVLIPHAPALSAIQRRAEEAAGGHEGLPGGEEKEGPEPEGHTTICVSSQVGCARGCTFCRTGTMGLVRCLDADEILAQVYHGRRVAREAGMPPLSNVVFMGMGEPLNNPAAVRAACERLTDDSFGFGFARAKITVSTVAPSPEAVRKAGSLPAMLAWSVHAAADEKRKVLVPTTTHKMTDLREAFRAALRTRSRAAKVLMVEVTMLDGVNDGLEDAAELADFLRPLIVEDRVKVCVNLIPYNDSGHPLFARSPAASIDAFQQELRRRGVFTYVRVTHGDEDLSACGQLATASARAKPAGKAEGHAEVKVKVVARPGAE